MSQESCIFSGQPGRPVGPTSLHYLRHLPDDLADGTERRWPLILFLHGRGERGDNLDMLKRHGISKIVENQPDFPFVTLSPQCPTDVTGWDPYLPLLGGLLDQMIEKYPIDPQRVTLTGLSMGGRGVWSFAVEAPQRFAALAPICGRIPDIPGFLESVCVLKDKPIWIFHGGRDPVVPIENSETMVRRLRGCGGEPRFTVYPEASHNSWTATYDNPDLYVWLAEQTLTGPRTEAS